MAPGEHAHDLTALIRDAREDEAARARFFELVYEELRALARSMPHAAPNQTLTPTALTNEVIVVLSRRFPPPPEAVPESRRTFFRTAALAMRLLLRDHWRRKEAGRRLAAERALTEAISAQTGIGTGDAGTFLALDEAMDRLERYNGRWHEVVLHRFFAGRTVAETAAIMGVSEATVKRDWHVARGWLMRELGGTDGRAEPDAE